MQARVEPKKNPKAGLGVLATALTRDPGQSWSPLNSGSIRVSYRGDPKAAETVAQTIASRFAEVAGFYTIIARYGRTTVAAVDHIRSIPLFYLSGKQCSDKAYIDPNPCRLLVSIANAQFDPPALREFAMTGYVTGPDALVPGICQLESGEVRVWHSGAAQVDRAWSYRHWPITQCRIDPRQNPRTPVRGN